MKIIRDLQELVPPLANTIVTIGNFDGIHLGHREIFRRVVAKARVLGGLATVVTFEPHPLKVLAPMQAPRLLNTYQEKERLIEASCIDLLVTLPFDQKLSHMSAREFTEEILVAGLGVRHLIIGYDYAFGFNREGDADFLRELGRQHGYTVEVLGAVVHGDEIFSSTGVRHRLAAGDVAGVVKVLGRHFTLEGKVVHGAHRGTQLGFPTANLVTEKEILPRPGVYAVKAKYANRLYDGVMNIGFNPTFGLERISLEVHLLDFSQDIYGDILRVYFIERLRDELVFSSATALASQISEDIFRARELLVDSQVVEYREYLDCGKKPGTAQAPGGCL
jgi:riboflavin kinase / FMN adenylyltransferase